MKKVLALLLSFVFIFTLWGCTSAEESAAPRRQKRPVVEVTEEVTEEVTQEVTEPEEDATPSSPILYKVTDADGHVVYLLGSIHVGTEQMYPFPDYVMNAYESADALAVECDIVAAAKDLSGAMELAKTMVLTDGTTIADHISEECYQQAVEILKAHKSYYNALDMYKPVMWYSLISGFAMEEAGASTDMGVDQYLLELAHDQGKTVYEVESLQQQYELLSNLSLELQAVMLEETVMYYDDPMYGMTVRGMCQAWAEGDAENLLATIDNEVGEVPPEQAALLEEFNTALEGQRNVDMTAYAKNALESGETVFIVVGAAHVLGEDGMAACLAAEGYTVEQVTQ